MEELERRVLQRLLTLCLDRQLIGPYQLEPDAVHIILEAEYQTFTLHEALRYLLANLEEAGLADEFYRTVSG